MDCRPLDSWPHFPSTAALGQRGVLFPFSSCSWGSAAGWQGAGPVGFLVFIFRPFSLPAPSFPSHFPCSFCEPCRWVGASVLWARTPVGGVCWGPGVGRRSQARHPPSPRCCLLLGCALWACLLPRTGAGPWSAGSSFSWGLPRPSCSGQTSAVLPFLRPRAFTGFPAEHCGYRCKAKGSYSVTMLQCYSVTMFQCYNVTMLPLFPLQDL